MSIDPGPAADGRFTRISEAAGRASARLNRWVEVACGVLMILLILDIWLGVFNRYFYYMGLTWTEEIARYLMIWVALLAVSSGFVRREHIGLLIIFTRLPRIIQRPLLLVLDLISVTFMLYLLYFGIGMVQAGMETYARAFGMPMAIPHASVPIAAALATIQIILVAIRDQGRLELKPVEDEVR